jgi:Cellulose binding domain
MRHVLRKPPIRVGAGPIGWLAAAATALAAAGCTQAQPVASGSVGTVFSTAGSWDDGYVGQYTITNSGSSALSGWTLEFDLPSGTTIASMWNGARTVSGRHVTVRPGAGAPGIAPGASVTVGFVASVPSGSGGAPARPTACELDDATCAAGGAPATGRSTRAAGPPRTTDGPGFTPYADYTTDLAAAARTTGVEDYGLAFVTDGGGCTPAWGGTTDVDGSGSDAVGARIDALRAAGGDVRVSFGGASGT